VRPFTFIRPAVFLGRCFSCCSRRCFPHSTHNPVRSLSARFTSLHNAITNISARYGNRLGNIHGPHRPLLEGRARLCQYHRANRSFSVSAWIQQTYAPTNRPHETSYPAGHVHIHHLLHRITDAGRNIAMAQQLYGFLYVLSVLLVCAIYKKARAPNWTLLLLPLSKRMHSLFVLRLFNDCWSVVLLQAAILAFQTAWDDVAMLLFR